MGERLNPNNSPEQMRIAEETPGWVRNLVAFNSMFESLLERKEIPPRKIKYIPRPMPGFGWRTRARYLFRRGELDQV